MSVNVWWEPFRSASVNLSLVLVGFRLYLYDSEKQNFGFSFSVCHSPKHDMKLMLKN